MNKEYDLKRTNQMALEIQTWSPAMLDTFRKMFPYRPLNHILVTLNCGGGAYYSFYFEYETVDKFWRDLHKFKILKAFL